MLRAVVTVLVLLVVCAYLALFLSWNSDPQPITTLQLGSKYVQQMPVGLLFIAGLLVGAVAMALALWGPWNALRTSEAQQKTLVQRAKSRLKSQGETIAELTEKLDELASQIEAAEPVRLAPATEAALADVEAGAEASSDESERAAEDASDEPSEEKPEDDPEII